MLLKMRMCRGFLHGRYRLHVVCLVAMAVVSGVVFAPLAPDAIAGKKGGKATVEEPPPPEEPPDPPPAALETVEVPLPENLDEFVKDRAAAVKLGKAFFWDVQAGSDCKIACASCHFHAGIDHRSKNNFAPNGGAWKGSNAQAGSADFPFHRLADPSQPKSGENPVVYDTSQIMGSAGVVTKDFNNIVIGSCNEVGTGVFNTIFNVGGINTRQVTGRNTPTVINAVFNQRQFWDGRANRYFNGVDPNGDMNPDARVWCINAKGKVVRVKMLLDHASLASQAVGPIRSDVEMIWKGRTVEEFGQKMIPLRPLAKQHVHANDSVLGSCAAENARGLKKGITYASMIRNAFHEKWWGYDGTVDGTYTQMEANFTLFWGLAINLYEATLVSGNSPVDRFLKGETSALTEHEQEGFRIFMNEGKCANCHKFPTTTGAATHLVQGDPIEFMLMQDGQDAFYDNGFYNIGVRPTEEDKGLSIFGFAHRVQSGEHVDLGGQKVKIGRDDRIAVDGAFKVPNLRNIELTGPYMHNGGMKSLDQVVEFYARRADFFHTNIDNLDPDVDGIPELRGEAGREGRKSLVAFLKALTDPRVRWRKAPFDHPEIVIVNGHDAFDSILGLALDENITIQAVGADGAAHSLISFEEKCQKAER